MAATCLRPRRRASSWVTRCTCSARRRSAEPVRLTAGAPHYEGKVVVGEVIYVDRFGTLVTNLTTEEVPDYAVLETNDLEVGRLQKTFGDVPSGGLVSYVGRAGWWRSPSAMVRRLVGWVSGLGMR